MVMWLLVTMLALLLFSLAFLSIFLADEDAHIAMFILCIFLADLRIVASAYTGHVLLFISF